MTKHNNSFFKKHDKFLTGVKYFFILLLYVLGTALILSGGYDYFVYPKTSYLESVQENKLSQFDLDEIYGEVKNICDNMVKRHLNETKYEYLYKRGEITLNAGYWISTPYIMMNGFFKILFGALMQFISIFMIVLITKKKLIQIVSFQPNSRLSHYSLFC